jgi:hypothetical protein
MDSASTASGSTTSLSLPSSSLTSADPAEPSPSDQTGYASDVVRNQAQALFYLSQRIQGPSPCSIAFLDTLNHLHALSRGDDPSGKLILSGVGKSGIVARKAAATFSSFGKGVLHCIKIAQEQTKHAD